MLEASIPNWAEFPEKVEELLGSHVVAAVTRQVSLEVKMVRADRDREAYLKFFTNRAL
jgi:hypothetical protein